MHIYWYGLSAFKIISKETTIFTDPFSKAAGVTSPRGGGDIIISSNPAAELYNNYSSISGEPFIIESPGEYDVKGIFVRGIPASLPKNQPEAKKIEVDKRAIFLLTAEGINLGFLGSLKEKSLTQSQMEELNNVDVLLVPVGGNGVCDAEEAVEIANELEPKIIIPMHYKTPGIALKLDSVERFLKEMGGKGEEMEKLLVKRAELEEEKTRIVILSPQRN